MTTETKTTLTYTGPPHQQCHALAQLTGIDAELEPQRAYEMPAEFAERLLASSAHWTPADVTPAAPKPPTMKQLKARAKELGLQVPAKAKVNELRVLVAQGEIDARAAAEAAALADATVAVAGDEPAPTEPDPGAEADAADEES